MDRNPIFVALERCCKECVAEPKVESFITLKNIINNASHDVLEPIQKFMRFPLHHVLNNSSLYTEALLIEVCNCLMGLCDKKLVIKSFPEFAELYINLFVVIDDYLRSENGQKPVSEDLKVIIVKTVSNILTSAPPDVIDECFNHEVFNRAIVNSVGVLLRIMKDEKSKVLKKSAVDTLRIMLTRAMENEQVNDAETLKKRNQLFSSFLPGIAITIMNLITSDDKHPQSLITDSLEILSLAIQLSFPHFTSYTIDDSRKEIIIETASKLKVALSRIINQLISSTSFQVKLALIKFTNEIFFNCDHVLVCSVSEKIIDVPLAYSCDSDVRVRSKASVSLSLIFKSSGEILIAIQDVILKKLLNSCKLLRQNIDSLSCEEKLIQFKCLTGIFESFQYHSQTFLHVPKNRNEVMRTFIQISTFKQDSISPVTNQDNSNPFQFQFLKSSAEVDSFKELVRSVSTSCDKQMLVDFLIGNLKETKFNEQFAFISLEILRDPSCHLSDDFLELIDMCIEEEVIKYPIISIRLKLAIEGLEIWSLKSSTKKDKKLLPIIYTILKIEEKTNLSVLSQQLGYENENDMIRENLSYFCDEFQREVNIKHMTSCSVILFRNLIYGSTSNENFDKFEGFLDTLLQILDLNYNKSVKIPLQMLSHFTDCMSTQFHVEIVNKEHPDKGGNSQPFCFKSSWSQYLQAVAVLESTMDYTEPLNHDGHDETREELEGKKSNHMSDFERESVASEEKELPVHFMIIKKIMERCANLLSLPDSDQRTMVLGISANCTKILAAEENELLPLVHKIWPSIINRLSDEIPVANKAFDLILQLSSICGDFVYRRIDTDVFPKILPYLRSHVYDGVKSRTRHPFTLVYRIQLNFLIGIGILATGMNVQGKSLWNLINVVVPYCSKSQPPALMKAAQITLNQLKSVDSDASWLLCRKYVTSKSGSKLGNLVIDDCDF